MKRFWMIALVLGLIAGFGLATAYNSVFAQSTTPQTPWGQSTMGGGMHGGRGGMMGGYAQQSGEVGPMHEYMEAELAAQLGMTEEELASLHDAGQTFWQIAEDKGISTEDAQQMMVNARSAALEKMVADGAITQEQADFMQTRMGGAGAGAGGCQGGGMGMRGGFRNNN